MRVLKIILIAATVLVLAVIGARSLFGSPARSGACGTHDGGRCGRPRLYR